MATEKIGVELDREESTEEMVFEEMKRKVISEIKEYVGRESDGKRSKNIAFIGTTGVGKSSVINTIAAAFSNKCWRQYAFSGQSGGGNMQVTCRTKSFSSKAYCNATEYEDYCLPTLIDVAGFENTQCETMQEVLRILFYGRLPDGTSLKEEYDYAEKHELQGLRERFIFEKDSNKIDAIVFVETADPTASQTIPDNLIANVLKAARPDGGKNSRGKRVIPIFGMLTNIDKVQVTDQDFLHKELRFKEALGLDNNRYQRCENYCDGVDEKYNFNRTEHVLARIDVPMLKFMKQVCDPVIDVQGTDEDFYTAVSPHMNWLEKRFPMVLKKLSFNRNVFKQVKLFLFIAPFLFFIMQFTSSIDGKQLNTACLEYEYNCSKINISYFDKICEDRNRVISAYPVCLWLTMFLAGWHIVSDADFQEMCKNVFVFLMDRFFKAINS